MICLQNLVLVHFPYLFSLNVEMQEPPLQHRAMVLATSLVEMEVEAKDLILKKVKVRESREVSTAEFPSCSFLVPFSLVLVNLTAFSTKGV